MRQVWILLMVLVGTLATASPATAQGHTVIFHGEVVGEDGQPAGDKMVVVFFNTHEVGRGETICDAQGCRFEILVNDETGIGEVGQDGLSRVQVGVLTVGAPKTFQAPGGGPPRRPIYAVAALKDDPNNLPPAMQDGRLGLLPDDSVVVIEPTRPPAATGPASQPTVSAIGVGLPWLWVALLALSCCGTLLALMGLGVLVFFLLRRATATS